MISTANGSVTVTTDESGSQAKLPLMAGTMGPPVVDIRKLYAELGIFTYDPGYGCTASCESKITYIDGDEGVLLHRGYPIEQLAEQSTFLEVAYLLMNGELPTAQQSREFERGIMRHTMLNEQVRNINDPEHRRISAFRLISKAPTVAAWAYKYSIGQPFVYPRNDLGYAENFLHMMNAVPAEPYTVNPVLARALDRILILHADHEQNASTSAVRLAGSTGANPFACIAAGVASLWGPAHGGANEAVLKMLSAIGHPRDIPGFIERVKDKNSDVRLMGFGHRVYKNYDPRAKIMQRTCHEVLAELSITDDPLLDSAMERIALHDDYFAGKKLYPNVDFYSGTVLKAMGIPTSMFTVLFTVARTAGWVSQWKEMIEDPNQRIGRPRQLYTGSPRRDFVPVERRG